MRYCVLVGILIVVAIGVGMWIGSRARERSPYDQARSSIDIKLAHAMLPFRVAFRVLLGAVVLGALGGTAWGGIRWLHHRANMVYADRAGLYPIRKERIGSVRIYHDPNRTVTGTTVYRAVGSGVDVGHPYPQGQGRVQQQITGQAQAAQALRAAVSGTSPLDTGANIPLGLSTDQGVSQPLPEVEILDIEPSHVQRLLQEGNSSDR